MESAEFRLRFLSGACGALVVVGGCCLVARDGDHRVYGWGANPNIQTPKHPNIRAFLSATRSLSAPSVRQRLSADETLAFWRVRRAGGTRLAHSKLCSVLAVCELWAGLGGVGIELSGVCGISFAFSLRRLRRLGGSGRLLSCSGATRTSPLRPWPSQPSSWLSWRPGVLSTAG